MASCRHNPTIDWLVVADAPPPPDAPPNMRFLTLGFEEFRDLFARRLGLKPRWTSPYKISELDPTLAAIFPQEVAPYEYWGYCDLDVIFGDIRRFYTDDVLTKDCITTHAHVVAGHFTLMRNHPRMNFAFRQVPFWRRLLASSEHRSFDEQHLSRLFMPLPWPQKWRRLYTPYLGGAHMREQFSTNLPPLRWIDGGDDYPSRWFFDEGRLTNDRAGSREFLYLHFSHWQSSRWTGAPAAWSAVPRLVRLDDAAPRAFMISAAGFEPLPEDRGFGAAA